MEKLGLKTLVINADTIAASQLRGENLWGKADEESHMIFLAPEQLVSSLKTHERGSRKNSSLHHS